MLDRLQRDIDDCGTLLADLGVQRTVMQARHDELTAADDYLARTEITKVQLEIAGRIFEVKHRSDMLRIKFVQERYRVLEELFRRFR